MNNKERNSNWFIFDYDEKLLVRDFARKIEQKQNPGEKSTFIDFLSN